MREGGKIAAAFMTETEATQRHPPEAELQLEHSVLVAFGSPAWAGGPPPMYVVVDKVVLEPSADAPERIRIEGCFVRLEDNREYRYGKPVEGFVYLSLDKGKEKETRAEWEKWQKAAGTGKAVAVGSCGEAGSFLTAKIHKPGERADKPDAAYTTECLGRFGTGVYADGNLARETPVTDLLAFAKARDKARTPAAPRQ